MEMVICGDGPMGRAVADILLETGHVPRLLGRPRGGTHAPGAFHGAAVAYEFSTGSSVRGNVAAALEAGCQRLVIGTTGWSDEMPGVAASIERAGAAAVVGPTFSPGAAVLLRTVEGLGRALGRLGGFDPFVVEWHRAAKRDRPSGTALALVERLVRSSAVPAEVATIRAGAAPGMHLVGFDAPGETLEIRLTARDRRSYAAGALLAADWLLAERRSPGIHAFESVVDDLLAGDSPRQADGPSPVGDPVIERSLA